jgi:hypothetical protein
MAALEQDSAGRRFDGKGFLLSPFQFVFYFLLFLLFPCPLAQAGEERIADLSVTIVGNDELRVSARLIRWMNPKLKEDILNGIPKDLFYTIALKKRFPAWFDEEVFSKTIKHTIKYDVLKKQYLILTQDDLTDSQRIVGTEEEMIDLISRVNDVKMNLPKRLRTRHTYYVSIKGEMKASRLPFFLEYILFFIPVPELDTPWANSAPFYAVEESP